MRKNDTTCHSVAEYFSSCSTNLRGISMFWLSLLVAGFALVFMKLGAYSVWMNILSGGFKIALLVVACLVIALIRKKLLKNRN